VRTRAKIEVWNLEYRSHGGSQKCYPLFFVGVRCFNRHMRVIGIDYGLRRTGVAIGDTVPEGGKAGEGGSGGGMALPFEVFEGLSDGALAEALGQLVRQEGVEAIVVGLPLNADGTVSGQSQLTERFIVALQQVVGAGARGAQGVVPIYRISEYLSTYDTEGKLAGHFTRLQKRARVDALAAARILQDWMDGAEELP
jgi:putative holliday junction resolvase